MTRRSGTTYLADARRCVAMPLGGIGTGNVAICGDGTLRQWQLHNIPNHSAWLPDSFFAIRLSGAEPFLDVRRLLQSPPVPPHQTPAPLVNDQVVPAQIRALERVWEPVASTRFEAAYPFARVTYDDPELPVEVVLEAVTPFVPLDAEASGLPLARFRFSITNSAKQSIDAWLLGTLQNAVGWDGVTPVDGAACGVYGGQVNRVLRRRGEAAVLMDNPTLADDDPAAGEMLLWASAEGVVVPRFVAPADVLRAVEGLRLTRPGLDLGDSPGRRLASPVQEQAPATRIPLGPSPKGQTWNAGIIVPLSLAPLESATIEFVYVWYFPNRYVNFDQFGPARPKDPTKYWIGNHYAEEFGGAVDVLENYLGRREELERGSRAWADALYDSDLPAAVAETLAAQCALARSPTTFRTADGRFYGFEGCLGESTLDWAGSVGGSCPLNCTHVWNYEQAISRLFPDMERLMRETDWDYLQAPEGYIPHRLLLPLGRRQLHGVPVGGPHEPALDGMLGSVLKTYREARLGAGLEWLARYRPNLHRLMNYVARTWGADGNGVLAGEQPITHDIALHGPNMFVGSLWLASLRAMEAVDSLLGDVKSAAWFRERFESASAAYDALLWNGEYYGQNGEAGVYDFGQGCLADQLVGQWWAHQLELGYLLPPAHVRAALASVVRYNLRDGFRDFRHIYRVFADLDDSGLLNCTWPRGGRPEIPIRYADEVWTGSEYEVAAHCIMEGLVDEGLRIIDAVRRRYDGTRRNPFNEIECGDHYVRAMSGWSVLEALTGFRSDALRGRLRLGVHPRRYPFVGGDLWGVCDASRGDAIVVDARGGSTEIREIDLPDVDGIRRVALDRAPVPFSTSKHDAILTVAFAPPVTLRAGAQLTLTRRGSKQSRVIRESAPSSRRESC